MKIRITTVITFWNNQNGVGRAFGTIITGHVVGVPGAVIIQGDFDNPAKFAIGVTRTRAAELAEVIVAGGHAPLSGEAYGVYTGDLDGGEHGCLVDEVNRDFIVS